MDFDLLMRYATDLLIYEMIKKDDEFLAEEFIHIKENEYITEKYNVNVILVVEKGD